MWFYIALLTGLLSSISVSYNKKVLNKVNASVLTLALSLLSIPLLIPILLKTGLPQTNHLFFLGVTGSATLYTLAKTLHLSAIKVGTLSQLIPLSTLALVFTYLFSVIILSETITTLAVIGLLLITTGTYILNAQNLSGDYLKPFKLLLSQKPYRLALLSALIASIIPIFDKIALNNSFPSSPTLTLMAQNIITTVLLLAYLHIKKPTWPTQFKTNIRKLFIAATIYTIFILTAFTAFTQGPVALVLGISNLRILLTLLIGYLFLNDKPTKHALAAAIIMILGGTLIRIGQQ